MTRATAADRQLERVLLFNLAVHLAAMASMAALLLPLLPGGPTAEVAERARLIADAPWRVIVGWFPWQLCALADLLTGVAMVRVSWIPRPAAWIALCLTACAVLPDQWGELQWDTRLIELAQRGDLVGFASLEARAYRATAAYGALFYTLGALAWTAAFARSGAWTRWLSWLSAPLWLTMAAVSTSPLLPPGLRLSPELIAAGNALGFVLLEVWLFGVTEAVLRRGRPMTSAGRDAPWVHPGRGPWWRAVELVANSRVFGALCEPLPVPAMVSDIGDVVYVNYLVEAERLLPLVPEGLQLQRVGPGGRYALFTWLTFQHGHFGVELLGPLRALAPSPVQSNWRIHVRDPSSGVEGIYFVTTAITNVFNALGARLTTEGMPMHPLQEATVTLSGDEVRVRLIAGSGSAPSAEAELRRGAQPGNTQAGHALTGAWAECWGSWEAFLAYCVPQERAMSTQPWEGKVTRHEIELAIDRTRCIALHGAVRSPSAEAIAGDAIALCFLAPGVRFRFAVEITDPLPPGQGAVLSARS